jgi:hypothetical protein
MNLPTYNYDIKWHTYIDIKEIEKSSIEFSTDEKHNNTTNNDIDIDLNTINFSLDNEKILNEIQKIIDIKDISSFTTLEILKKQDLLSSYLSKSIQNTDMNIAFLIQILEWLMNTSEKLNKKLKIKLFTHDENLIKSDKVIRSSYKFCNFKHNCSYNYDNKKKGCYADHFVHHMVYADIESLLKCIKKYYANSKVIQNKEIVKCINTISFVIKHMYEELHNLCMYCSNKKEHDKYHVVKSSKSINGYKNKKFINSKKRNENL